VNKKLFLLFFSLFPFIVFAGFNVKKSNSRINVKSGANFVVDNVINNYKGKLVKEEGASVSGDSINFNEGVLEDAGSKLKLTGNLALGALGRILLDGGKIFKGKRGDNLRALRIRGKKNRLEGSAQPISEITLDDKNTTVTCALQGRVGCNIVLNGGKVFLEDDLNFADDVFFTGSGVVNLNKRTLRIGATDLTTSATIEFEDARDVECDANLSLESTWTFSGESILKGRGNILCLGSVGEIVVRKNSSLLLQQASIRELKGYNIRCEDTTSTLSLQSVKLRLSDNYSFTQGSIYVRKKLRINGDHKFIYQSAQTSIIGSHTKMIFDRGTTFSFDPIWNSSITDWNLVRDFFEFEDGTAVLELKGATLHVTPTTGMKLKKGKLRIKDESYISSELDGKFHMEEGLILGNNNAEDDAKVEIMSGASLVVSGGALSCKNMLASSFEMLSIYSSLSIASGAKLKLHQSLDVSPGTISFGDQSRLARVRGKVLEGSVHLGGTLIYEHCYNGG
jgi:hypothetical protein